MNEGKNIPVILICPSFLAILTLNRYKNGYHDEEKGTPVVISTSTKPSNIDADSDIDPDIHGDGGKPMCIEGNGVGPLEIVVSLTEFHFILFWLINK